MILMSQVLSDNLIKNLDEGVMKSWLQSVLPSVLGFFWSVVLALLIAYIGGKIINLVRRMFQKSLRRRDAEEGVCQFADQLLKYFLWIVIIVIILGLFGFTASSLAAAVASLGVTAGLALQGSLSNFAGGLLILVLHPFRVGDYIIEDTHKNEGTVIEISVFYTKLRTIDNKIIVIPNGTLANTSLTNATKSDRRQMDLVVPIGYDADIKKAKLASGTRVYISWGEREGKGRHALAQYTGKALEVTNLLTAGGATVYPYCQLDGRHCEADWRRQLGRCFTFLFGWR